MEMKKGKETNNQTENEAEIRNVKVCWKICIREIQLSECFVL